LGSALGCAIFFAGALASKKLLKSFSKVHTVLILLATSWLGMGLAWFVARIFPLLTISDFCKNYTSNINNLRSQKAKI
ncbi:MAG TPA: hypothetical protein VIQ31_28305, partial [Phormidium sp.]